MGRLKDIYETTTSGSTLVGGQIVSPLICIDGMASFLMQMNWNIPGVLSHQISSGGNGQNTAVNLLENTINIPNHQFVNGLPITINSAVSNPPSPLVNGTVYFTIFIDENTIQFAANSADALFGIPIILTDIGTPSTTFTIAPFPSPPINTAATMILSASNDGINFFPNVSKVLGTTGIDVISPSNMSYRYIRININLLVGNLSVNCFYLGKGF